MTRYIGVLDGKPGAFGIYFPDLPGCCAMGETLDAAYSDAVSSMQVWAQHATADGEALPKTRDMDTLRADPHVAHDLAEGGATFVVVPLLLDSGRSTRANISIDAGLLEAIDAAARERGLTRSAFLISAAREKIASGA